MSIDGAISVSFAFNDRRTVSTGFAANLQTNPSNATQTYSNGSGAGQVSQVFGANRTFSGSTDTLDLLSGLTDSYGTSVTLARVKALLVVNTGTSSITVGAGTDPWSTCINSTGTFTLQAGACLCVFTPDATAWATTASTGMNLNVTGTSGQTYEVAVAGSTT
jgi:hypothetical protein